MLKAMDEQPNGIRVWATCRILWIGLLLLAAMGCDRSGLNLAPVEGVVTLDGAPVVDAGVMFTPGDPSTGPPSSGTTNVEGRFTLVTANRPGAPVGDHRVAISKDDATVIGHFHGMPMYRTTSHIPVKYSSPSTSDLTASVADDENYFEFKLTSK